MNHSPQRLIAAAFCSFGWLSSFTYAFHFVGPYQHPCTDGDTLPYLVSIVAGPVTLSLAALLLAIGSLLGVAVRWPALLHVATLAAAGAVLPAYLANTTVAGQFICVSNAAGGPADFPTATWQRGFVPVQNAAMVLFGIFLVWYWRRGAKRAGAA